VGWKKEFLTKPPTEGGESIEMMFIKRRQPIKGAGGGRKAGPPLDCTSFLPPGKKEKKERKKPPQTGSPEDPAQVPRPKR